MRTQARNTLLLALTALIWGLAFIAQSMGASIGAFTFLAARSWIGAAVIIPVMLVFDAINRKQGKEAGWPKSKQGQKTLIVGGMTCGLFLFLASAAQQLAITLNASTAKAGFITAMYVVLVPIVGMFLFRKKTSPQIWFCVLVSVGGLYLLCMKNGIEGVETSDWLLILCAFVFTFQILSIDYFSPQVDSIRLSVIQFLTVSILSTICAFLFETPTLEPLLACVGPILYCGVLSSGVAYTLQMIAQKDLNPAIASITMCLESVFAAVGGWLILKQVLTTRESLGCALIFGAVVFAQIPLRVRKTKPAQSDA